MRIIDEFDVLLFDVQMTLMFDVDRFAEQEDYHSTYRNLGGSELGPEAVRTIITKCINYILPRYKNPQYFDCFPSLEEALKKSNPGLKLPNDEMVFISKTFAFHECGHIPEEHVEFIKQVAKTHRLGLVSNIWADKDVWIKEFARKGILELFEALVFSSDYSSIKPSLALFKEALNVFDMPLERCVFIGDSHYYDVAGAKVAGLKTVLTTNNSPVPSGLDPKPDFIVSNLPQLLRDND